jgi:tRNA modification GTPase
MMSIVSRETICATATPMGEGAIGAIRISGKGTFGIIRQIFRDTKGKTIKNMRNLHIYKGFIHNSDVIDNVLLFLDAAPNTYTGEDLAEIYCHNNLVILGQILKAIIQRGGRLAEPGEFTRRRMQSGKINLAETESLLDLYQAKTEQSKQVALRHNLGDERRELETIRSELLDLSTAIELSLEYQEPPLKTLNTRLGKVVSRLAKMLDRAAYGLALKNGVNVVLVGDVNVGKSSLFNALLSRQRSIVSPTPGTTRDVVSDELNIKGVIFRIYDTAGHRTNLGTIEIAGREIANEYVEKADIILHLQDRKKQPSKAKNTHVTNDKRTMVLWTKGDLFGGKTAPKTGLVVSAKTGLNLGRLKDQLYKKACGKSGNLYNEIIVSNERHVQCLERAKGAVEKARVSASEEVAASLLNEAIAAIDEVGGLRVSEEVINKIFSQFCVGK